MREPNKEMSPFTRLSVGVFDWATLLTAIIMVRVNGIDWPTGLPLILFGLIVDVNRFVAGCWLPGRFTLGSFRFPFSFYLRPRHAVYIMGAAVLVLLLLYLAFPRSCWPSLNTWIETNVSIVKLRLQGFPRACEFPHGSVLLLSQALLPIVIVIGVAIPVTSSYFYSDRFIRDYEKDLPGQQTINPSAAKPIALGVAVLVLWTFVIGAGFISFTPDNPDIHHIKPLRPQDNALHFLLWLFLMLFPVALGAHMCACGKACMLINQKLSSLHQT